MRRQFLSYISNNYWCAISCKNKVISDESNCENSEDNLDKNIKAFSAFEPLILHNNVDNNMGQNDEEYVKYEKQEPEVNMLQVGGFW